MPTGREVLEVLQEAGVEPEGADNQRPAFIQPVTRHCYRRRARVGHEMLKLTWEAGSRHFFGGQEGQERQQDDAAPG